MTLRTRAGSETSNQMSRNKNLKKLRQRYKSTMIISLDAEGLDRLVVNEQFRLVLVSDAAKPKPELMSVQDINVIDFNLNESAVNAILLHRVVSIENAPLAEQLDKWLLKRARTALSLRAIEQQLLEFLSASEGALIAEAGEMSKLNVLRKRQDKVKQDADRAADALEADRRSEQQYIKIAAAALQVHCALTSLLETFGDSSFLVGLPVLQGVMDSSLTSSPKGASGEKEPNRLAQAAADVRLDLHRAVSLGLGTRNRRLFTIQLSLTFMEHSGLLTHEEAMLLVAICTHHKEPLEAARKALEERQQRDDFEADRLRAMEAGGTPARDPSNGNTLTGGGKTPQSGAGKDKNTGGMPTRATTATPSERPKMAPVHVPPSTAHGGMRGAGGKLGPMIDLTEQPEQLKFIESQSWDTIMQLSQMWQVEE